MTGMIILAFALGYPAFMILAYGLAKILFTPLDRVEEEQKRERALLLHRARRRKPRKQKPVSISRTQRSPVFELPELNPSHS